MCTKVRMFVSRFLLRPMLVLAALTISTNALCYIGDQSTAALKSNVPIHYYKGFMLALAFFYGIYLVIRARQIKRANKLNSKSPESAGS